MVNARSESFRLLCNADTLEFLMLIADIGELNSEQRDGLHHTSQQMAHAAGRLVELKLAEVTVLLGKEGSYRVRLTEKGKRVTEFIAAIQDELE